MNVFQIIMDIIMALIIALLILLGIRRGFVKSFFRSTKVIFVILLTLLIGSFVVTICQNMFVENVIDGSIGDRLVAKAQSDATNFGIEQIKNELPSVVTNIVDMEAIEDYLVSQPGDSVAKARVVGDKIEEMLISIISNVMGYLVAFVISFVVCTIAIYLLEKLCKLPFLNWLNRIGGIFWGLANAYLTTSFVVCVVALILGNDFVNGTFITKAIYEIGLFTF